jgi:hypothetical protein
LGYGYFGPKVNMDNAPLFDYEDSFNPAFLRLADIDGSGTIDVVLGEFRMKMKLSTATDFKSLTDDQVDNAYIFVQLGS